jgi:mRNA interferase RelE/StbE
VNYEITLSGIALKSMEKIPKRELIKINEKIDELSSNPRPEGMKKIQGDENLYRIRSGNYRVIYRIFDKKIEISIVDVDHRKDIYKKLS